MTETVAIVLRRRLAAVPQRHDRPADREPAVLLRNPETGADAPPGQPAELVLGGVPGEDLFLEYLDDPAATSRALVQRDGATWFPHRRPGRPDDAGSGALRFVAAATT